MSDVILYILAAIGSLAAAGLFLYLFGRVVLLKMWLTEYTPQERRALKAYDLAKRQAEKRLDEAAPQVTAKITPGGFER